MKLSMDYSKLTDDICGAIAKVAPALTHAQRTGLIDAVSVYVEIELKQAAIKPLLIEWMKRGVTNETHRPAGGGGDNDKHTKGGAAFRL